MYIITTHLGGIICASDIVFDHEYHIDFYDIWKHCTDTKNIHDIYSIDTDRNGFYQDITADIIPGFYRAEASQAIDEIKKTNMVLSWSPYSCFHLYLPEFLRNCTKAALNKVLNIIKQFSKAVKEDIEKILFSISYTFTGLDKEYKKLREWLFNNKIYQDFFGSAAADEMAAGECVDLNGLDKIAMSKPATKTKYFVLSHDLYYYDRCVQQACYYDLINYIISIIKSYFKGTYKWLTAEYLTKSTFYICSNTSGKCQTSIKIIKIPDFVDLENPERNVIIDQIKENTVVCVQDVKKLSFDFDTEAEKIKAAIKEINNQKAAEKEATEMEAATAENVVEPSTAAEEPAAENIVEPSTAAAAENNIEIVVDDFYFSDIIIRFRNHLYYYMPGSNNNTAIFSPANFYKLQCENTDFINDLLQVGYSIINSTSGCVQAFVKSFMDKTQCIFDLDKYICAFVYAIKETGAYYNIDIISLLIPDIIQQAAAATAENPVNTVQQDQATAATATNTSFIIWYNISVYSSTPKPHFYSLPLEASENKGPRPPNIKKSICF